MHETTSVPALTEEICTFLKRADVRDLDLMFRAVPEQDRGRVGKYW